MGSSDSDDIIEMICASLISPPYDPCNQFGYFSFSGIYGNNNMEIAFWVVFTILVVIALIIGGVIVYKKTVKKEITNEMSLKVTEMVTQYIKLASDQERKSKNKEI